MLINALNPPPSPGGGGGGGAASPLLAVGDLDDDEDAGGHTLGDTVRAAINRRDALRGELTATMGGKVYRLVPEGQRPGGKLPFFMHRERGLHLDERDFTVVGLTPPMSSWNSLHPVTFYHISLIIYRTIVHCHSSPGICSRDRNHAFKKRLMVGRAPSGMGISETRCHNFLFFENLISINLDGWKTGDCGTTFQISSKCPYPMALA